MKWAVIGAGLAMPVLLAQPPPQNSSRPEFAVASVKPNKAECCTVYGVGSGAGGGTRVTLKMLIALVYRLQQFQIAGGPKWIGSDRFDVQGKAEDPKADYDRLRLMLRALLEDRFQLKLHRETKEETRLHVGGGKRRAEASIVGGSEVTGCERSRA